MNWFCILIFSVVCCTSVWSKSSSSSSSSSTSTISPSTEASPKVKRQYLYARPQQFSPYVGDAASAFRRQADRNAQTINQVDQKDINGNYNYAYKTTNGIEARQTSYMVGPNRVTQGYYSYIGPDGQLYTVHYIADQNGYRASGSHLPVQPGISVQPLQPSGTPVPISGVYPSSTPAPFVSSTLPPFVSSTQAPFVSSTQAPFISSTYAPPYGSSTPAPFGTSTPFGSSTPFGGSSTPFGGSSIPFGGPSSSFNVPSSPFNRPPFPTSTFAPVYNAFNNALNSVSSALSGFVPTTQSPIASSSAPFASFPSFSPSGSSTPFPSLPSFSPTTPSPIVSSYPNYSPTTPSPIASAYPNYSPTTPAPIGSSPIPFPSSAFLPSNQPIYQVPSSTQAPYRPNNYVPPPNRPSFPDYHAPTPFPGYHYTNPRINDQYSRVNHQQTPAPVFFSPSTQRPYSFSTVAAPSTIDSRSTTLAPPLINNFNSITSTTPTPFDDDERRVQFKQYVPPTPIVASTPRPFESVSPDNTILITPKPYFYGGGDQQIRGNQRLPNSLSINQDLLPPFLTVGPLNAARSQNFISDPNSPLPSRVGPLTVTNFNYRKK